MRGKVVSTQILREGRFVPWSRLGLTHCLSLGDGKVGGRRVLEGHDQVSVEQSIQHHLL